MKLSLTSVNVIEEMIKERISDSPATFEVIRHPNLLVS